MHALTRHARSYVLNLVMPLRLFPVLQCIHGLALALLYFIAVP